MEELNKIDRNTFLAEERTKLAAERTFLAWLRTGLTSIGIGIAIARFIFFKGIEKQHLSNFLGQMLILWGIGIFVLALVSYYRTMKQYRSVSAPPYCGLFVVTIILILLSFFLFWIVVE